MEEAERVADTVAVIDYGKIIAQGSPRQLAEQTGASTLEEAFLNLTGRTIREEKAETMAQMMSSHMRRH